MNGLSITVESFETAAYDYPPDEQDLSSRIKTAEASQERLWSELSSLYAANEEQLKTDSASKPASKAPNAKTVGDVAEKLDHLLDSFMDGVNVFLEELTPLGNAHPVLAIAIFAFHEVVKLDIARRDNNKKVLLVVMQMQSMMGPMFQLRNLKHDHMPEAERDSHEGRLKELIAVITRNIKECRSDISHFMNRKFMVKLVLAKGYEKKFATHMETFASRRSELQSLISEYLAIGVSSANATLAEVGKKVDVMDSKLDVIISKLFRNLDTPREREVFKFIQQNGGPEKCVNDLDLLPKLISKAGESTGLTGNSAIYDQKGLQELQKQLREALVEDLDKVLEKHYSRFEKILQVQNNNLKSMSAHLEDQGVLMQTQTTKLGKILDTVTTIMVMEEGKVQTKAVKLKDPEIHRVWTQMNLTSSSVKAKLFVLTFRDHIRHDNSIPGTPVLNLKRPPFPGEEPDSSGLRPPASNDAEKESADWVLDYIDVAYVQPIVEAMDEDGSGFISVKEANSFALARPKGLSLLHWIAYWAAGWHLNLENRKKEIYSVLLEMLDVLPLVHVANRAWVDDYIDDVSLRRVEALLRSIKPLPDTAKKEPKLTQVANTVASSQLERLQTNLNDMGYFIESGADATTIGGSARVETWILPLLLLLLRRHLQIIHLAKTIVLDKDEFEAHIKSLASVFAVFDERKENLDAKFRQLHRDIDAQFQSFAYGMFHTAFKGTELKTSENTLLSLKMDEYDTSKNTTSALDQSHDISILSKPIGSLLQYEELDVLTSEPMPDDHVPHPLEGSWFGLNIDSDSGWKIPFCCVIHPFVGMIFKGKGEWYSGTFDITSGKFATDESFDSFVKVTFDNSRLNCTYQGVYDPEREVIEGTFSLMDEEDAETQPDDTNVESEDAAGPEVENGESQEGTEPVAKETEQIEPDAAAADLDTDLSDGSSVTSDDDDDEKKPIEDGGDHVKGGPIGRFYLRRTPPDVFRFRYLLDGPGPAPCWNIWPMSRKRWAFAIEAVLFQTRLRIGSREAFRLVLAERRKWLSSSIRYDLTDSNVSDRWFRYKPLSDQEWEEYTSMMWAVHPTIARLYETMSHYLMSRNKWSVGLFYCDACGKSLAFTRYQCVICMEDDLSHSVDLCDNCYNKSDTVYGGGNFTHIPSHSLVRSRQRVHVFQVKPLIAEARLISERCKTMFRALEAKKTEVKELGSRKATKGKGTKNLVPEIDSSHSSTIHDVQAPTCACCNELVTLPCWVCILCSPLTFMCDRCDKKNAEVVQPGRNHSWDHRLLRIHDSIEVKSVKTNEMERQLEDINSAISSLENKVRIQLEEAKEMKAVVDEVAKTMGVQDDDDATAPSELDDRFAGQIAESPAQVEGELETEGEDRSEDNGGQSKTEIEPKISEEEVPTRPKNDRITFKSQMDLGARLSALEAKVENMNQNNQSLEDRYASLETKIDNLEAKIDQQFGSVLTLMQQLLSQSPNGANQS